MNSRTGTRQTAGGVRRVGRAAVLIGVMIAAVAAVASPAAAARTIVDRDRLVFDESFDCGGGVTYDILLNGRETTRVYFGAEGPQRIAVHTTWRGTAVGSNGTVLRVHHAFTVTVDLAGGTMTVMGLPFGAWVAGSSLRAMDRGVVVIDLASGDLVFEAGRHQPPDPHGTTCALLAAAA